MNHSFTICAGESSMALMEASSSSAEDKQEKGQSLIWVGDFYHQSPQ